VLLKHLRTRPPAAATHFVRSLIDGAVSLQFYSFPFSDFIAAFLFLFLAAAT
jgi:hypothetical protein